MTSLLGRGPAQPTLEAVPTPRSVEIRISEPLFARVRAHVEDFARGEEAGFLICGVSRLADRDVLLAREWLPITEDVLERGAHGSILAWSAQFNSDVLAHAVEGDAVPVLVHSHGHARPSFSADDREKERRLFGAFSRILAPAPTGTLLLGQGDATGSFWIGGANDLRFRRLVVVGNVIDVWPSTDATVRPPRMRERLDRQVVAIGPRSDSLLAAAKVAVVGISGGGSHVVQQTAHQGVGTLIPLDDDVIDLTNLGRVVGATMADVDRTRKVDLAVRVAQGIDPDIAVIPVAERFPSPAAIAALKEADIIVACVDRFDVRAYLNAFCRRYLIPLVDVGMSIRSNGERLVSADGQVGVSLPGNPCLQCWLVTDAVLAAEREEAPAGYDRNADAAGDPQVVSMNGVLASEACNSVLDLITGYSGGRRGAVMWQYEGRRGQLEQFPLPSRRPACPGCAEESLGDPMPLPPPRPGTEATATTPDRRCGGPAPSAFRQLGHGAAPASLVPRARRRIDGTVEQSRGDEDSLWAALAACAERLSRL